jgi:hypothetical protein
MAEKLDLFAVVNNILDKQGVLSDEEVKASYNSFMINRAISNHQDLIFFAEKMNENWQLDSLLQYHFYYYIIGKRKRWAKWPKRDKALDDKIELLKEYYGYSTLRAREAIPVIDSLDLWGVIKDDLNKGGRGNTKHSRTKWSDKKETQGD